MERNLSVEKVRAFLAALDEGERREIMKHWTRAAERRTQEVFASVFAQLYEQIAAASVPGPKEVLITAVSAWNDGALAAMDELLGLQPMDPRDVSSEIELLLKRMDDEEMS